jgi:hypothetical protein
MDLSIELKSRLGEYGSVGSFAVCPLAVPDKASNASKMSATKSRRWEPTGNRCKLGIFLIDFSPSGLFLANRTRSYPSDAPPFFQPEKPSADSFEERRQI